MPLQICKLPNLRCNNDPLEETQTRKKDGLECGTAGSWPILGNTPLTPSVALLSLSLALS
jgi:hypothetical protein